MVIISAIIETEKLDGVGCGMRKAATQWAAVDPEAEERVSVAETDGGGSAGIEVPGERGPADVAADLTDLQDEIH
jgi:hypothetical protein